jgi:hypothetical protein
MIKISIARERPCLSGYLARWKKDGYDALVNALGPEDTVRFIRSFDPGSGDYTKDWMKIFKKKTIQQIGKGILELQKSL